MKHAKKFGFSILELSVVLLILAIIIGAIMSGGQIVIKSRIAAAQALTKSSPVLRMSKLIIWYETTISNSFSSTNFETGSISTWYNLSPAFDTNNAVAGTAPTYTDNAINSLPALTFNGSSTYLQVPNIINFFSLTRSFTLFVVFAVADPSIGDQAILTSSVSTSDRFSFMSSSNILRCGLWNGTTWNTKSVAYSSKNTGTIASTTYDGSTLNFYINGVATSGSSNPTSGSTANFNIGRRTDNITYFNGKIGEIIGFSKVLSDDERREIEQYLSKKWKITLS